MCYRVVTICIFDKLFFEPTFFPFGAKRIDWYPEHFFCVATFCWQNGWSLMIFSADMCRVQVQRWHMELGKCSSEGRPRWLSRRVLSSTSKKSTNVPTMKRGFLERVKNIVWGGNKIRRSDMSDSIWQSGKIHRAETLNVTLMGETATMYYRW